MVWFSLLNFVSLSEHFTWTSKFNSRAAHIFERTQIYSYSRRENPDKYRLDSSIFNTYEQMNLSPAHLSRVCSCSEFLSYLFQVIIFKPAVTFLIPTVVILWYFLSSPGPKLKVKFPYSVMIESPPITPKAWISWKSVVIFLFQLVSRWWGEHLLQSWRKSGNHYFQFSGSA